ncbi:ATPase family AAA domain-containing protein At1g05910 [Arachis ipaensis]|uniref:Bromo domain-containing protein n=1 Tax=Arachis hypogaea TaxID=3818 RepID=A0A444Y8G8_ARAHY|nr:ATPase family AAA domain-containing protein At1g05910 [Arachis ipaensis]XP_016171085.1 ATPase family AAA domain-containing protein At1g05910 [Arachis ipaensis]XP_020964190.1 ATPase family AAA domain-containing protein At1g05910 [Arachis ipaensis]XP_020964192.1 ATPase family AAA domain-containing protein At1g05910 [Arachis ipaensis]XP_020964193.1 ATPase family AAA domain-containing protein At1g05910 [Arachis ipaensis]XP_020964194.1 ATPase family AAA domain-containing protein At1g05910 [Arach
MNNSFNQHKMLCYKRKRALKTTSTPGREGLRPLHLTRATVRQQLISESDDKQELAEEKVGKDETENGNVDGENEIDEDVEDEGNEDGDDEGGEEEQVGRRRYDLRNRPDVRRSSMAECKIQPRSPQRVLHQGMGTKVNKGVKKGGSRVQKRCWLRPAYSDDSLIVDELNQYPAIPWGHGDSRPCQPWLFGGLDMHGITTWGLNVAASGWVHEGDAFSTSVTGVQTAGPSSKGGADIQPLQAVDSASFDDIGGLSKYIDALKEMIFFPLLYPEFFASYHITPPRGVLLCGPPGTGKTLIARALACAASKAGQKVSFYMRKGADVLSKWVGEAERQLKLLFEEAQKNQPSIIFFDEIDGLAPVRSSNQEQIHNSIVSTLLALMDGLDSRGQVVLIGATNRIDAIDGALRRPGRFDREFKFPLPGCEARSEILDIHTRKWKHAPSDELRMELASSCVGYCGADLKTLCTEAAICAFREKYPQVYTSDDQFLIDVDSVKVEKYHFTEAMSTITPAAHRGAVVHSRPLSLVVRPCLRRHLEAAMGIVSDIFLPVSVASEFIKLSTHAFGRAIPLVYRPRLLLCGSEGTGLDHLGPAVLHELEKFPVFSLGISVLVSDSSAITPEEALIRIFNEARRTTPSILYLPQFDVWWETAHEQLRAVLLTLLEELPSDLPILLFGTSSVQLAEVKEVPISVFPHDSVYQVNIPSAEDRMLFFTDLVEAVLSVFSGIMNKKPLDTGCFSELPKAPKLASGPKASELKAKVEAEQHALRRLRMCLRDVCNKILYDKRYNLFHYPVSDEDAPNYHSIIQNPMDMVTMLQRVDNGWYITRSAFLQDIDLIVSNAKAYNGEDYNGARIVSRACQLRDVVHGMISQMDPALVAYCDKIAAQGGPVHLSNELRGSTFPATPVVQLGTATRLSARLRNVEPEVSVDQSYEALKHTKKSSDVARGAKDKSGQDPLPSKSQTQSTDGNLHGTGTNESVHGSNLEDATISDTELSTRLQSIKQLFVERSDGYSIPQLERLYSRIMKRVSQTKLDCKTSAVSFLLNFVEDGANF